jgi:hypothetical protein
MQEYNAPRSMNSFANAREAKEFLVSRIVEEAQRENTPLSEVERKMLYFSETDWTLPDIMDVSDEFDRTCDQDEYEKKISLLISNAYKRTLKDAPEESDAWWAAIRLLNKEDHYISVMVQGAGIRPAVVGSSSVRPPHDNLKLFATACAIAIALFLAFVVTTYIPDKYKVDFAKYWPSRDTVVFAIWVTMASVAVGYTLLRWVLGAQRFDDLTSKLAQKLFRTFRA